VHAGQGLRVQGKVIRICRLNARMEEISFSLEMAHCYGRVLRACEEGTICAYMLRACECFCADLMRLAVTGADVAAALRRGGVRCLLSRSLLR
jgi:hypothetical protein